MAGSAQRTVTTAATLLDVDTTLTGGRGVLMRNRGSVAIYLGGTDVTTSNGFQLDPGETISIDTIGTGTGVAMYAVTASSTAVVHVLQG